MARLKHRVVALMPYALGIVLAWLLFYPPAALTPLGPWRFLVPALLVPLLLVAFTAAQLVANLPDPVSLVPVENAESVSADLLELGSRLQELGFVPAGPAYDVGVRPPAILLPFVHEAERAYSTAFRTRTLPAKTVFDFVSILDSDRGALTSMAERAGAALPAAPGVLRQVFPGRRLEEVWRGHREGLGWLRQRGLAPRAVSASTFVGDLQTSFARQRRAFLAAPLRTAVLTLWRALTGRAPELGPLASQPRAQAQLQALLTGQTG
jgi:hypothetical protein